MHRESAPCCCLSLCSGHSQSPVTGRRLTACSERFQKQIHSMGKHGRHEPMPGTQGRASAAGQTPKMLSDLRRQWAPKAFAVSFKLETDTGLLLRKVRGSARRQEVSLACCCCGGSGSGLWRVSAVRSGCSERQVRGFGWQQQHR